MEKPLVKRFHKLYDWKQRGIDYVVTYDALHQCEAVFTREEWEKKVVQIVRLDRYPYFEEGSHV